MANGITPAEHFIALSLPVGLVDRDLSVGPAAQIALTEGSLSRSRPSKAILTKMTIPTTVEEVTAGNGPENVLGPHALDNVPDVSQLVVDSLDRCNQSGQLFAHGLAVAGSGRPQFLAQIQTS